MNSLHRKHARRAADLFEALEPRTLLSASFTNTIRANFIASTNGSPPAGLVMDSSGIFFGITASGGARNYGTVVRFTPGAGTSGTLTTLFSFTDTFGKSTDLHGKIAGIQPHGQLVLENGNLFGVTTGGGAYGKGTLFEVPNVAQFDPNSSNSRMITLASFDGSSTSGAYPFAGLIADSAGNLYGTTIGANATGFAATLFKFTFASPGATTGTLSTLATLHSTDQPNSTLVIDSSGNIFGTTMAGGATGQGTIFEIYASSQTFATLASFNGTNGSHPDGGLVQDVQGDVIGHAAGGGANGDGTIFIYSPSATGNKLTALASFNGTNGNRPVGNLILDSAGNIFGTTSVGGASSDGNFFELAAGTAHTITSLYNFSSQSTGINPTGALVADGSGNFWGETFSGGRSNAGTIFELQPPVAAPAAAAQPLEQLVITRQPAAVASGTRFTLIIKLEDAAGHVINSSAQISLALASGPAGAIFGGTHTVHFVHGVATFSNLVLRGKGTDTLNITSGALELVTGNITVR